MNWRSSRWGGPQTFVRGAFDERAFRRAGLPTWDALWHNLTVAARTSFLSDVKIPPGRDPQNTPASAELGRFSPAVLKELTQAGFVELRSGPGFPPPGRVFATWGVHDFALRLRTLKRHRLLDPTQLGAVRTYVNETYFQNELKDVIVDVLRRVGISEYLHLSEALERYVLTHRWVNWVVAVLNEPLAAQVVEQVVQAGGPMSLVDLVGKIKKADAAAIRLAVDQLVAHLVLFEDIDPVTLELRLGLLPSIREPLIEARRPRPRPPLVVCESLKEVGPEEGHVISDLRALLLELASAPARLKQDRSLFQKEVQRFENVLESLPGWLCEVLKLTREGRLNHSLRMARGFKFVDEIQTEKAWYLQLSPGGQQWLIGSMDDQFQEVVAAFRTPEKGADRHSSSGLGFLETYDSYGYSSANDSLFLGASVVSVPVTKEGRVPGVWEVKPGNAERLRRRLDEIFAALPVGVYYRSDSVVAHAAFGEHNPLLLGTGPRLDAVAIHWHGHPIPPLADRVEEVGRALLLNFLGSRLIPLGCVRIALNEPGGLALARDPRLDAYFGRPIARERATVAGTAESKVVVQPDYSIVIIGPSAAPAAELLPFCERTSAGSSSGALVLKITRESVLRAIGRGLPPGEVLVRLKRHASHELPANVVREVEGWAGWVRQVALERLTVLRCPDREAADRVMGALAKRAERVHETIVAITPGKLTTVERQKLLGQGILVGAAGDVLDGPMTKAKPKPKARPKRRRVY